MSMTTRVQKNYLMGREEKEAYIQIIRSMPWLYRPILSVLGEFVEKSRTLAFVAGSLRPDELNDRFDTKLPEDEADTIGGMIFEKLGRPAVKGDEVIIDYNKFLVLEVEGNRLKRLRVEKLPRPNTF